MEIIVMEEVKSFVENIGGDAKSRVQKYLTLLKNFSYNLRMPYSKNILPGIFELRVGGLKNIRLIYAYFGDSIVIFYAFEKKTEQISIQEIRIIKMKFSNLH
jgi:phage-related protein